MLLNVEPGVAYVYGEYVMSPHYPYVLPSILSMMN